MVCGADLNLRIRRGELPWIGEYTDIKGSSGVDEEYAHRLCKLFNMSAINTHTQNIKPDSRIGTFLPAGALDYVRCDYFLASFGINVEKESCFVDDVFDKHAISDDHLPIRTTFSFPAMARRNIRKRRQVAYSRAAIQEDLKMGPLIKTPRRQRVEDRFNAIRLPPFALEGSSQAFVTYEQMKEVLVEEYPMEQQIAFTPWMTDATYNLCKDRSKQWAFYNMLGRRIGNATCWFVLRWFAACAKLRHKPKWNHTRGPATKELCLRRVYERDVLYDLSIETESAIAADLAAQASRKANELEKAALNNDSHGVSMILESYKKKQPRCQERLLNEDGDFASSYTEERTVVKNHFCGTLKGTHSSLKQVLDGERKSAIQAAVSVAKVVRQFECVPEGSASCKYIRVPRLVKLEVNQMSRRMFRNVGQRQLRDSCTRSIRRALCSSRDPSFGEEEWLLNFGKRLQNLDHRTRGTWRIII